MGKSVDYYVCLVSPWTYLGDARLRQIADQTGAKINYKPMNLSKVFPETGGLPLAKRAPARRAYRMQELIRWRDHLGVEITLEPAFFPANEWPAAGMVLAAQRAGLDCGPLVSGFLRCVWAEDRNIADKETMITVANECGFDGAGLSDTAENDSTIADVWDKNSAEALKAGVFGAPAYVVGDQLFWGQDRLEFVARALENA